MTVADISVQLLSPMLTFTIAYLSALTTLTNTQWSHPFIVRDSPSYTRP